jgi:hypothetical protein
MPPFRHGLPARHRLARIAVVVGVVAH